MRRWGINFFFLLLSVMSGVQLFVLKYRVIDKEDELKAIHRQILSDSREIHMLKADWALLNDPGRLRALVAQTGFKPIESSQILTLNDIPFRPSPAPVKKPEMEQSEERAE